MDIVLATGIYPPDIGGPATYVEQLALALTRRQMRVRVLTYGQGESTDGDIPVIRVSRAGGPLLRWRRYAQALKHHAAQADIVYAFSSVSCGIPLWWSGLSHPRKLLRLGGDFLWERYTDRGGLLGLRAWYASEPWFRGMMNGLLTRFDHIVFSTAFQEELYEHVFRVLPMHSVIENALPQGLPVLHARHTPMRLLFLGRFVSFKNLGSLLIALQDVPEVVLTLVGEGPLEKPLKDLARRLSLGERVTFLPPHAGDAKQQLFLDHDLLLLPSLTELSPNTALEARASGLPVLLTEETGLSRTLADGAMLRKLDAPEDIAKALREAKDSYEVLADRAASALPSRSWEHVADEHLTLFRNLL